MLEYNENTNTYDLMDNGYDIMQSLSFDELIEQMEQELDYNED